MKNPIHHTDKRLEDALDYLSYCVKEGALDEGCTDGKTPDEIIAFAEKLMDEGDRAADAARKGEG